MKGFSQFASQIILSSPAQTMCLTRSHLASPFIFCHYHHFHLEIVFYPRCKHVIAQGNSNRVVFLFFRTKDQIPSVVLMQAVGGGIFCTTDLWTRNCTCPPENELCQIKSLGENYWQDTLQQKWTNKSVLKLIWATIHFNTFIILSKTYINIPQFNYTKWKFPCLNT